MFERIRSRLNLKVALLVTAVAVVVFGTLTVLTTKWQHESMLEQMDASMRRATDLMRRSIEKPMVVGDNQATSAEFAYLAEAYPDTVAYMTNFKGNVTYATNPEALRKDLPELVAASDILEAAEKGLTNSMDSAFLTESTGTDVFVRVIPIPNEKTCHHCHGASEPVLGELLVVKDVGKQMGAITTQTLKTAGISLAGLLALVGACVLLMKRLVIRPVQNIARASRGIAQGDYNQQLDHDSTDELGQLAENLSEMVATLKEQLGFSQGVLKGMSVPCAVVDTDEKLTYLNGPCMEMLKLDGEPGDYLGRPIGGLFYADETRSTKIGEVMRNGTDLRNVDMMFKDRMDNEVSAMGNLSPLRDLDGNIKGGFCIYVDVTEQKRQAATIEAQNQRIAEAARQAGAVADQVSSASEELSAQIEESSRGADEQRTMTGEAATAMEEMNASVLEVARNAANAAELADGAKQKAAQGQDVVQDAVELINGVADQTDALKADMSELGRQADGIGKIIVVIQDIADQTNLLALNAAIEAARAGDAGRGFAVVADEVRKLAEKTMAATRDVGQYITTIQSSARKSIENTEQAVQAIAESTGKANLSGEALAEILSMVEETADQVRSIATASEQQSAASEEISRSTDSVNRIAAETADAMSQSSTATQDLARLAQDLTVIIHDMQAGKSAPERAAQSGLSADP